MNWFNVSLYVALVLTGFVGGFKVATWLSDSTELKRVKAELDNVTADRDAADVARKMADDLRAQSDAALLNFQEKERLNNVLRKSLVPRVVELNSRCDLGNGAIGLLNDARRGTAMPAAAGVHAGASESSAADTWLIDHAAGRPDALAR